MDKVRRWRESNLQPQRQALDGLSPVAQASVVLKARQARRLELDIKEIEGDLIDRAEAQRQAEAAMVVFRAAVLQGAAVVADRLESAGLVDGLAARDDAERILSDWGRSLLEELSAALTAATSKENELT